MQGLRSVSPFEFVSTPEEMELIYTMCKLDCLVLKHLQRQKWHKEHESGREPPIVKPIYIPAVSIEDSYKSLLGNLTSEEDEEERHLQRKQRLAQQTTTKKITRKERKQKGPTTFLPEDLSANTTLEANRLMMTSVKAMRKISLKGKENPEEENTGATSLLENVPKPLSVQTSISNAEKASFNAYINVDDEEDRDPFKPRAKQDDIYQTGPLTSLAQQICKASGQPVDETMELLRRDIPKMCTGKYVISTDDVLNLSVRKILKEKHHPLGPGDEYTDIVLDAISKGSILSAISCAKNTLEPVAAAVLSKMISIEADQAQNFDDISGLVDQLTHSNSTTTNASANLYKAFVALSKRQHGKGDVTAGELLRGVSEHGT